jgi:hypothetical protein
MGYLYQDILPTQDLQHLEQTTFILTSIMGLPATKSTVRGHGTSYHVNYWKKSSPFMYLMKDSKHVRVAWWLYQNMNIWNILEKKACEQVLMLF